MIKVSSEEVVKQVAEVLAQADGEFIQDIANAVLGNKVIYREDSLFDLAEDPAENVLILKELELA